MGHGIVSQLKDSFYLRSFESECERLSATCVPRGSDRFGDLLSASLWVRAPAYPAHRRHWVFPQEWRRGLAGFRLNRKRGPTLVCVLDFTVWTRVELHACTLILIASYYSNYYNSWILAGLVVHPAREEARFIRIGSFISHPDTFENHPSEEFREAFRKDGMREFEII